MKVGFIEIDCGPGGTIWEMHTEDHKFLRSYGTEDQMLQDAILAKMLGHEPRFYTQAEWNLEVRVEMALEHMEDSYG